MVNQLLAAVVDDVVEWHGLFAACAPGFEKAVQLVFQQLERLFAPQHQNLHPVPSYVEDIAVAEEVAKVQVGIQPFNEALRE